MLDLSVLDQPDVSFVDVGVALQCHAPQHTLHTTLRTLDFSSSCSRRRLPVGARPVSLDLLLTATFLNACAVLIGFLSFTVLAGSYRARE